MFISDLLGERARLTPDSEALVDKSTGNRFSYKALNTRSESWAHLMTETLELKKGDRLGFLCSNRVEFMDVFFGCGKTGVILVPLNTHLAAAELFGILQDADVLAMVYDSQFSAIVSSLKKDLKIERWMCLDAEVSSMDTLSAPEYLKGFSEKPFVNPEHDMEDIYALLYTSGTTGKPKGVMISRRMIYFNGYNTVACWQLSSNDISPIFTPLYHAGGLGAFLIPVFTVGGTLILHPHFDAEEVFNTIVEEKCTVVLGVPTIWKMLSDSEAFQKSDLSHVKWFISGGAPLPVELIQQYREKGVVMRQGYGLTEVGVNCFSMTDQDAWNYSGSIGKPFMFTDARIVDENNQEMATDEVGELVFRGPHLCSGYWHNSSATEEAFDKDGFFHTGDLARKNEKGFFYIAGRKKEMFISGGVNIYPAEIESILLQHEEIADAVVIGVTHDTWGEVGAAFIVVNKGVLLNKNDLLGWLSERVAKYKLPKKIIFMESLPRTPYGKVLRPALKEYYNELNQ